MSSTVVATPPSASIPVPVEEEEIEMAPDFTLSGFQAIFPLGEGEVTYKELKNISLSDFRGKLVLIEFWGSWCPYCAKHMLGVEAAYRQYRDRGFVVLGLEMGQTEGLEGIKRFVQEKGITFPVLLDRGEAQRPYRVTGVPTSFLIGPDGVIEKRFIGGGYNWASASAAGLIEKYLPKTEFAKNKEVAR
jgi:peroxiredoxin